MHAPQSILRRPAPGRLRRRRRERLLAALAALLVTAGGALAVLAVDDVASIEGWLPAAMLAGLIPLFLGLSLVSPYGRRSATTVGSKVRRAPE